MFNNFEFFINKKLYNYYFFLFYNRVHLFCIVMLYFFRLCLSIELSALKNIFFYKAIQHFHRNLFILVLNLKFFVIFAIFSKFFCKYFVLWINRKTKHWRSIIK